MICSQNVSLNEIIYFDDDYKYFDVINHAECNLYLPSADVWVISIKEIFSS